MKKSGKISVRRVARKRGRHLNFVQLVAADKELHASVSLLKCGDPMSNLRVLPVKRKTISSRSSRHT